MKNTGQHVRPVFLIPAVFFTVRAGKACVRCTMHRKNNKRHFLLHINWPQSGSPVFSTVLG